jgi:hypothetical protein
VLVEKYKSNGIPWPSPVVPVSRDSELIILLVEGDVSIDSKIFFVTDFVNLKIKSTQFFRGAHKGMVYVRLFIGISAHMCMSIYIYTLFFNKKSLYKSISNLIPSNLPPTPPKLNMPNNVAKLRKNIM